MDTSTASSISSSRTARPTNSTNAGSVEKPWRLHRAQRPGVQPREPRGLRRARAARQPWLGLGQHPADLQGLRGQPIRPLTDAGRRRTLHISQPRFPDSLSQYIIGAAASTGLRAVEDYKESDDERTGPAMAMIQTGLRVSAARAFLNPVLKRPNLHLAAETYAQRLVFENGRAVGAQIRTGGNTSEVRARREVIVANGCFALAEDLAGVRNRAARGAREGRSAGLSRA
jgi:choline dehydrogenase-like flavoprotein